MPHKYIYIFIYFKRQLISFCVHKTSQQKTFSVGLISLPDGDGGGGGEAELPFYCNIKGSCNMKLKTQYYVCGSQRPKKQKIYSRAPETKLGPDPHWDKRWESVHFISATSLIKAGKAKMTGPPPLTADPLLPPKPPPRVNWKMRLSYFPTGEKGHAEAPEPSCHQ